MGRPYSDSNLEAFSQQKRNARRRGVLFELTFEQWLSWWGDDLGKRGRSAHDLVMARNGDSGPYALGNIVKMTSADNRRAAGSCKVRRVSETAREKQREVAAAKRAAGITGPLPVRTSDGMFPSADSAAKFYGVTPAAIRFQIKRGNFSYVWDKNVR